MDAQETVTKKKIVIALGGNALGNNLPEQMLAVKRTAAAIGDLIEQGHTVVISHGNGPQVGMLHAAMGELNRSDSRHPVAPLSVCVAMSQGYIGYDLQNALHEELLSRGIQKTVTTLITQVRVHSDDPAFAHPSKPIGRFMTQEQAQAAIEKGDCVTEDAGRGYRRVVASPMPIEIMEIEAVRALCDAGQIVVTAGGGGIPVVLEGNHLKGVPAVIDKDFASCLLAEQIDADALIILTAVEKVAIHFGKPDQQWLSRLSVAQALQYIEQGEFAAGSMLPKVQAAVAFASAKPGRTALITLLEKAKSAIEGETGTIIAL